MKIPLWRQPLVLVIYLPTLLVAFGRGLLVPVLPLYAKTFETSYALIGLALAGQGLGMLMGDVPAGLLERRLGRRNALTFSLAWIALTGLAMSWAQSVWELFLYGLLAGIGHAQWNISRHTYLSDAAPIDQRGQAIALFGGLGRVGSFIGPLLGGTIGAFLGLRAPFVLFAILTLLCALLPWSFAVDERRGRATKAHEQTPPLRDYLKAHYGVLLTASAGQMMGQMIRAGREVVLPLYGADILQLDVQSIGMVVSTGLLMDALMFYPAGVVMDRFGRKFAYVPSFAIQALGMMLVPFTWSFLSLMVVATFIGFGNGLGSGTMMTLGADLAPRHAIGEFLGLWRLIGDAGASGGALVVGAVANQLTLVPAIFVMAGAGAVCAIILGWWVPETLQRTTTTMRKFSS